MPFERGKLRGLGAVDVARLRVSAEEGREAEDGGEEQAAAKGRWWAKSVWRF